MRRAIAVVRGCCQISAAQIGIRFRFRRQTQLQPASSSENSGQYTEKLGFGLQGNRRRVRPTRTKARAHRDAQFAEPPKDDAGSGAAFGLRSLEYRASLRKGYPAARQNSS